MRDKDKSTRSISFTKSGRKNKSGENKTKIHPRNKHQGRYDLDILGEKHPKLSTFVRPNVHGNTSIDFANPQAVKALNSALLKHYYELDYWDIPSGYLCPPIPGRADYIHHVADILSSSNYGRIPVGNKVTCVDIGVGANCIYPIIGHYEYGWEFIGTDINKEALDSASKIVSENHALAGRIDLRLQKDPKDIFYGVLRKEERVDLTICNPPFHASAEAAKEVGLRKLNNLSKGKVNKPTLNFGGKDNELWTEGGERRFIGDMIRESKKFGTSCFWFSTLISKQTNLKGAYAALNAVKAAEIKTIAMGQGNKSSRIVAWTFLTREEQKEWRKERWNAS